VGGLCCQEISLTTIQISQLTLNKAASPGQWFIPFAVKSKLNIASLQNIEKLHKFFRHWSQLPPVALARDKNFNIRRKSDPVADDTHC
jgi:hypothetical protein